MADRMLDELTRFYRDQEIYSAEFNCKYHCELHQPSVRRKEQEYCLHAARNKGENFIQAKSAYVGEKYESEECGCRLLFLSLDPGKDESVELPNVVMLGSAKCRPDADADKRTPEGLQKRYVEQTNADVMRDKPELRKNKHWYGTLLLAVEILRKAAAQCSREEFDCIHRKLTDCRADGDAVKLLPKILPYFASATAVKCSLGIAPQAPDRMYQNCSAYLKGELPLLKPDIIVTQGNKAAEALCECIAEVQSFSALNDKLKRARLNAKSILWIKTYHPRNGCFWTEGGKCWSDYADAAATFMSEKRGGSGV